VAASSLIGELPARRCGVSDRAEQETPGLLQALAQVPDPRDPRGRIHPLPGLPAIAAAAVAAGQSTLTEIAEWATDLPDAVLARPGAARDPFTGLRLVPDDSTFARVLAGVDADAPDTAICRWLIARQAEDPAPGRRVIAVDGKTLRTTDTAARHVLAAGDRATGVVLAGTDVDGTTNELLRSRATSRMVGKCGLVGPVDAV
jgi:DDE_Tnp_1-associated